MRVNARLGALECVLVRFSARFGLRRRIRVLFFVCFTTRFSTIDFPSFSHSYLKNSEFQNSIKTAPELGSEEKGKNWGNTMRQNYQESILYVSTGPLACPFTCLLTLLTHSLAPPCSLRSLTLLTSLIVEQ